MKKYKVNATEIIEDTSVSNLSNKLKDRDFTEESISSSLSLLGADYKKLFSITVDHEFIVEAENIEDARMNWCNKLDSTSKIKCKFKSRQWKSQTVEEL